MKHSSKKKMHGHCYRSADGHPGNNRLCQRQGRTEKRPFLSERLHVHR